MDEEEKETLEEKVDELEAEVDDLESELEAEVDALAAAFDEQAARILELEAENDRLRGGAGRGDDDSESPIRGTEEEPPAPEPVIAEPEPVIIVAERAPKPTGWFWRRIGPDNRIEMEREREKKDFWLKRHF